MINGKVPGGGPLGFAFVAGHAAERARRRRRVGCFVALVVFAAGILAGSGALGAIAWLLK